MFLAELATQAVYIKPLPNIHRTPMFRPAVSEIHYVQRPNSEVTACGLSLQNSAGLRFTVDRELMVDQCPSCSTAAWLPTKDNAMTRAGIDCRLYPAGVIHTA